MGRRTKPSALSISFKEHIITPLQQRAQAFLNRPIPEELAKKYVSGSISELFIGNYAVNGSLDAEDAELIGICAFEADAAADRYKTPEAKAYFSECASILAAIGTEQPAA